MCIAAVGLVGDLARALGLKVLPFCDEIMMVLLENLGVSRFQGLWKWRILVLAYRQVNGHNVLLKFLLVLLKLLLVPSRAA